MRKSTAGLAAALAVLAGCDTTFPWSKGSDVPAGGNGASIAVNPSTLAFTAQEGGITPSPRSAALTVQGIVYVDVQYSGSSMLSAAMSQTSPTTADVIVTPASPVVAGSYAGTVTVRGCVDAACTSQVQGSPATIAVSYVISPQTLVVNPTSLAFDHVQGAPDPAAQSLAVSDAGSTAYTAAVAYGGPSGWLSLDRTGGTLPDAIAVTVNPASLTPASYPATYSATVTVTTSTGSRAVPVTLTVRQPGIQAPASAAFAAVRGQTSLPAAQALALTTDAGVSVAFTTGVTYGTGASGWLAVPAGGTAPSSLSVAPSTSDLAPGSYTATIRITPSNGSPAQDVAVTYDVTAPSLSVVPGAVAFTVTAATTSADIQQALALSDAGTPLAYSTSTTAAWLSASPLSGATGTDPAVTVSLVPSELALLADGTHAADVVLSYAEPSGPTVEVRVPVALDLSLPRVSAVAPRVAVSGTSAEVILRGTGLLDAAGRSVSFGTSAATAFTVTSATELRATHPALGAGTYTASVSNGLGLPVGGAALAVVDPVTRTAASTPFALGRTTVVFDDVRAAAFVAAVGTVERYRETNGWARETLALSNVKDVALSPDGTRLVAVAGADIWEIDPDAFVLPAQPAATLTGFDAGAAWRIAFANDGKAVLASADTSYASCRTYDFQAKGISTLPGCSYYRAGIGAAEDGRRVVVAGSGLSPAQEIGHYDASAGAFQASTVQAGYNVVAPDRTASRVVFISDLFPNPVLNSVRDASYAALGALPSTTLRALPSSDGTRAYAWDSSGKVRVFDLTAAPVSGIFPELGTVGGTATLASPGASVRMALSADGLTLFLAGDQGFVVFPLP